jgi:DNA polymerase elongation subunit (family B)
VAEPAYVNGFVDDRDLVLLYRNARGALCKAVRRAEWVSYLRARDLDDVALRGLRTSARVVGMREEGEWLRVEWVDQEARTLVHQRGGYFDSIGVPHYEADVSPLRRFFSDSGAKVGKPRRAYLDIETDSRVSPVLAAAGKARVLCWVLKDEDLNEIGRGVLRAPPYLLKDDPCERLVDEAERQLLEALWTALDPYDQVVAWYGDGFDFPVIRLRSQILGANMMGGTRPLDVRRWAWIDLMEVYDRHNQAQSGDEKESLSLQAVATALIGEGKKEYDASKTYEGWVGDVDRLVEYCAQDTLLLPKIERKKRFLALVDAICDVARVFPNTEGLNPTHYVDAFMLRLAVEQGTHFLTRRGWTQEERDAHQKFKGALVIKPRRRGILRDVHVADFSGMYPSIILTQNMSPETKRAVPMSGPIPPGHCRSPVTRVGFALEPQGMLCLALTKVRALRKEWTKLQASYPGGSQEWFDAGQMSLAYKVIANTFYGVVGSIWSRYFDVDVATSTTQTGVWLIQATIQEAEKRGMRVLYSDTDSCAVENTTRAEFAAFVEWCNRELYPRMVAECGCTQNHIEIAYEKEFERLVFVAAKKYTGTYRHYKWTTNCVDGCQGSVSLRTMRCEGTKKSAPCGRTFTDATLPAPRGEAEIRGLAYRRGDSTHSARSLQKEVIDLLMGKRCEDPAQFVVILERYRRHILEDELALGEVVQAQSLTKPLRQYASKRSKDGRRELSELPHVQIAHVLAARGEQITEGTKIPYYLRDASQAPMVVAHAGEYANDADRYYLWERKVYPATQDLLEAAFPEQASTWDAYASVRPKKNRADRRNPEQTSLFGTVEAVLPPPVLTHARRAEAPIQLFVQAHQGPGGRAQVDAMEAVLRRYPGARNVTLMILWPAGYEELEGHARVAECPEFYAAAGAVQDEHPL